MNKRSIVAGAAAALLVAGTGGAAIGANLALLGTERDASDVGRLDVVTARAELDTEAGPTAPDGTDATPTVATSDGFTAEEAVAIAAAEVGGTLLEVEWTTERGRNVYEVERLLDDGRRVEVYVDAADGTVLEVEVEGRASTAPMPSAGPAIGTDRAIEIAVAEVGGTLVEVERDREDGIDLYGVALRQADGSILDVHVDAVTGAVLRIEVERRATSSSSGSGPATPAPAPVPSAPSGSEIGADRAVEIAIAQVGGTLVDVERDREDGVAVYDVELRQADGSILGVDVDRSTGAVLRVGIEDADWDDDDDDDWDDDDDDDDDWDDDDDD